MCGWFHPTDSCLTSLSHIPDCLLGSIWWVSNQRVGRFLVWVHQWHGYHSGRRTLRYRLVLGKISKPRVSYFKDKEPLGGGQSEELVEGLKDILVTFSPEQLTALAGSVQKLHFNEGRHLCRTQRKAKLCMAMFVCSLGQKWRFKRPRPSNCFSIHFLVALLSFWDRAYSM